MSRVKGGTVTRRRHKKLLKQTKGYWGQRSNVFRRAKETWLRAMANAYAGRKIKKRDMRGLFVTRIGAGAKSNGMSYSTFIAGLKSANVQLNRKMLSQLAVYEPTVFAKLVTLAKS